MSSNGNSCTPDITTTQATFVYLAALGADGESILKAAINKSYKPTWFLTYGSKNPDICKNINKYDYLNGTYGLDNAAPGPNYQAFASEYVARWNTDPINAPMTQNVYDGVYLAAIAMELAKNPDDSTEIRDILTAKKTQTDTVVGPGVDGWKNFLKVSSAGTVNYVGASGDVDFQDPNNAVISKMQQWQVTEGADSISCTIEQVKCWNTDATETTCD